VTNMSLEKAECRGSVREIRDEGETMTAHIYTALCILYDDLFYMERMEVRGEVGSWWMERSMMYTFSNVQPIEV